MQRDQQSEMVNENDKKGSQGPVKKRSLSSYLSNVNARKIELQSIAKREEEGKGQEIDVNTKEKTVGTYYPSDAEVAQSEVSNFEIEYDDHDNLATNKEQDSTVGSKDISDKHEKAEEEESKDTDKRDFGTVKLGKQVDEDEKAHVSMKKNVESTSVKEEHHPNVLPEPPVERAQNLGDERDDSKSIPIGKVVQDASTLNKVPEEEDDDESALSEVESDAPTEPASPPRPRLGRLVRGDQLESITSKNSFSDSIAHNSDSELSDLADLNSVPISSSVLQAESSPTKSQPLPSSSPRKPVARIPSQKSHGASKGMKHIAVSKVAKPRKRVHRDAGGRTKLQIACDKGKYDLVKQLIEEGYDINDQDNAGNSPLHEAALNGHLEIVKLLLKYGANVNIQSYEMFKDTPLIDASANGHLEVVKELLHHGADPTIVNAKKLTAIESIEDDSELNEEEIKIARTIKSVLRKATRKYRELEARDKAVSPRAKDQYGNSDGEDASQDMSTFNEPFYWTDISSKLGRQKLFRASKEGKLAYVGAFLENGGHADFKSFMESVKHGHEDIASLFLAFGASANAAGKDSLTSLMVAVGRGHLGTVKLLLEAGADPTKCDKNGRSVLYYAKHSSLGLVDNEEISMLKRAIRKRQGQISDDEEKVEDEGLQGRPIDEVSTGFKAESSNSTEVRAKPLSSPSKAKNPPILKKVKLGHELDEKTGASIKTDNENSIKLGKQRTASPHSHIYTSTEEKTSVPDRERTSSPSNIKRSVSATSIPLDSLESTSKKPKLEGTPTPTQHQETAEEREARLRSEEQYKLKRLENRRKKEQEFLQKLADDERKRQEERERAMLERKRQLEEEELRKHQKEQELRDKEEIEERQTIRLMYPLGLRLVDFENKGDFERYLPVPYITQDNKRYILELQLSILLKDPEVNKRPYARIPVDTSNMPQLWNIYKFIFLYGGHGHGKYVVGFNDLSLEEHLRLEAEESKKFFTLKLTWICYDDIQWPTPTLKEAVEKSLRELELIDPSTIPQASPTLKQVEERRNSALSLNTPVKFRLRPAVSAWVSVLRSSFTRVARVNAIRHAQVQAISKAAIVDLQSRWEGLPASEQSELVAKLSERQKLPWNELTETEKQAAWYISYGEWGPRRPVHGKGDAAFIAKGVAVGVLGSVALFALIRQGAADPPKTMTKEWQLKSDEYLKSKNANPWSTYSQVQSK